MPKLEAKVDELKQTKAKLCSIHQAEVEEFRVDHEAKVKRLRSSHQVEVERLRGLHLAKI